MSADEVIQAMIDESISVLAPIVGVRGDKLPADAKWCSRSDRGGPLTEYAFGPTPTLAVEALLKVLKR